MIFILNQELTTPLYKKWQKIKNKNCKLLCVIHGISHSSASHRFLFLQEFLRNCWTDARNCICLVTLQYRFFLQKTNLDIVQNSFRDCTIVYNLCIYMVSFILVSSSWHNSFFMFFLCKKMPTCTSCICTVSLQYKFFLQKANSNIL